MKKSTLLTLGLALIILVTAAVVSAGAAERTFIGAEKCKLCHKLQYESWAKTSHATAFGRLTDADKAKAECVGCHTTNAAAMPNVQCEACHGAGSEYKSLAIMKDREKSIAAGLTIPDEALCTSKCHNNKSPNFKEFDFKTAVAKVHEHKAPAK